LMRLKKNNIDSQNLMRLMKFTKSRIINDK
jgi:hypothetical protein